MTTRPRWPWLFWVLLTGVVLGAKLTILAWDSVPRVFLGDSGFYLYSSLTGAVPHDRSFSYGRIIRFVAGDGHAIGRVITVQVLASAAAALLVGVGLRVGFGVSYGFVALGALLATFEPLQLAYERFVLTESLAGLCYAVIVAAGVWYLSNPRAIVLVVVAVAGAALLSLRLNAIAAAWAFSLALPCLAWPTLAGRHRGRPWLHLALTVLAVSATHTVYREVYGHLRNDRAAYYDGGGHFLLGFVSPLVKASDFPAEAASRIMPEVKQPLRLPWERRFPLQVRDSHMWSPDGLVSAIKRHTKSIPASDALAREVAVRAVVRDPLDAITLGVLTLRSYFDPTLRGFYDPAAFAELMPAELGPTTLPREAELEAYRIGPASVEPSPIHRWHAGAVHYYPFILVCPLLALLAIALSDRAGLAGARFLFIVSVVMVATGPAVAASTVIRYLHPLSWVNVFVAVLVAEQVRQRLRWRTRSVNSAAVRGSAPALGGS